jgi:hypothetical protein
MKRVYNEKQKRPPYKQSMKNKAHIMEPFRNDINITSDKSSSTSRFTVLVQNTQSLKNKVDLFEDLLQDNHYKAVCIAETWISTQQKGLVQFKDYEFAAAHYRSKQRGGGVAILVRHGIPYKERTDLSELSIDNIMECCAVELQPNILLSLFVLTNY